ncbi:MAG TPA: YtxH domain-containing protein [Terriglobales bacterium]|nr:YtxH domain-containing protein [Terriglobales bacterium]
MSRGNAPRTIFTFILGIGVGALAALLLAPKAGKELRSDIANGVSDGVNQVNAAHKGMKKRAQKIVALAQDHVTDTIEAGRDAYSHAKKA